MNKFTNGCLENGRHCNRKGRYRFYTRPGTHTVIAESSYAGRCVRGCAICSPNDDFDFEVGKELAQSRCDEVIGEKRYKRANEKYKEALRDFLAAEKRLDKMNEYRRDSFRRWVEAYNIRSKLETKLGMTDDESVPKPEKI